MGWRGKRNITLFTPNLMIQITDLEYIYVIVSSTDILLLMNLKL